MFFLRRENWQSLRSQILRWKSQNYQSSKYDVIIVILRYAPTKIPEQPHWYKCKKPFSPNLSRGQKIFVYHQKIPKIYFAINRATKAYSESGLYKSIKTPRLTFWENFFTIQVLLFLRFKKPWNSKSSETRLIELLESENLRSLNSRQTV